MISKSCHLPRALQKSGVSTRRSPVFGSISKQGKSCLSTNTSPLPKDSTELRLFTLLIARTPSIWLPVLPDLTFVSRSKSRPQTANIHLSLVRGGILLDEAYFQSSNDEAVKVGNCWQVRHSEKLCSTGQAPNDPITKCRYSLILIPHPPVQFLSLETLFRYSEAPNSCVVSEQ